MPLTPKNRKEEWLEGLVQHETTLTPKNRPEAWMKEIIDASGGGGIDLGITDASAGEYAKIKTVDANGVPTEWESGSGGGGGSNVMIVTLTYDDVADDGTYTSSATATEITTANSEGKVIIGRSDIGSFFIYVVDTMGMITIRGIHLSHNNEDIVNHVFSMNTNTNKWTETTLLCTYHLPV